MKAGLYPKLAWNAMRKNKRLYVPYLLTCIGMVMMYYIITSLSVSPWLAEMAGGATLRSMLSFGSFVILLFSAIFLFYTNSFLSRRRSKEFGLYNILGMGKWHIARILLWETIFIAGLALLLGCASGLLLSKLAELGLSKIIMEATTYHLSISFLTLGKSLVYFSVVFFLIFVNSLFQLHLSKPVELLRSESVGEKPPKANWLLGILGAIFLSAAYVLSVTIQEPAEALLWFFAAVLMVVLGSYLLFIAGSVVFCRLLQKHKRYYYQAKHFVSISSMVYRMKRNGAGLASICILATMVLVMISSSASLYFGAEDSLNSRYPTEMILDVIGSDEAFFEDDTLSSLREEVLQIGASHGMEIAPPVDYRAAVLAVKLQNGVLNTDVMQEERINIDYSGLSELYIIPLSDYNRLSGSNETLASGEALFYCTGIDYPGTSLAISDGLSFQIRHLDQLSGSKVSTSIFSQLFLIVPDLDAAVADLLPKTDFHGQPLLEYHWIYAFDTQLDEETQVALYDDLRSTLGQWNSDGRFGITSYFCDSHAANSVDFYGTFGGMFFLGILLSLVFIFAAVLILYYKQISEGYEDQARFSIMQKVGMTKREIRQSINSQLLTVFFLPLVGAGLHLTFAFPIIHKLLMLFNLYNVKLFAFTTILSFVIFALFYTLVYRITSNAYYTIVSGIKAENTVSNSH